MSTADETLIGHIIDVRSSDLTANLLADEQEAAPKVTVGDEDILVGQLGSYISVRQGAVRILCIVTRVSEQEKLADTNAAAPDAPTLSYAQRTISLIPIGTVLAHQ